MAKKKADPAAAAALRAGSSSRWLTKRRKQCLKWIFWVVLPLGLACAVAVLFGSPEPPPVSGTSTNSNTVPNNAAQSKKPPPMDIWANPAECVAWSGDGQCKSNPDFMKVNCAFSCYKLELAQDRYNARCPRPDNYTAALQPAEMSRTFARIMSDFAELEPEQISQDPPVILFHNFLSSAEREAFIRHGQGRYEKSLGVGMKEDGTMGDLPTEIRTSAHGWCKHPACLADPHVQAVVARVSDITQTPETNAEFAQLVYYHACDDPTDQKCAFYREHNDYIDGDLHKLQGVRIYTLFSYLNDVPEGGGTRFTKLPQGPVTFQPQAGKAILWPSVLEAEPHVKDERTNHEALPVTKGEKFGANFWIHQYDFKGSYAKGCTAS